MKVELGIWDPCKWGLKPRTLWFESETTNPQFTKLYSKFLLWGLESGKLNLSKYIIDHLLNNFEFITLLWALFQKFNCFCSTFKNSSSFMWFNFGVLCFIETPVLRFALFVLLPTNLYLGKKHKKFSKHKPSSYVFKVVMQRRIKRILSKIHVEDFSWKQLTNCRR